MWIRELTESQILQLSSGREQNLKSQEKKVGGTCDAPRISQTYDQLTALGLKEKIRVQEQRDQLVAGGKSDTKSPGTQGVAESQQWQEDQNEDPRTPTARSTRATLELDHILHCSFLKAYLTCVN